MMPHSFIPDNNFTKLDDAYWISRFQGFKNPVFVGYISNPGGGARPSSTGTTYSSSKLQSIGVQKGWSAKSIGVDVSSSKGSNWLSGLGVTSKQDLISSAKSGSLLANLEDKISSSYIKVKNSGVTKKGGLFDSLPSVKGVKWF